MNKPVRFIVIDDDLTDNMICRHVISGIVGQLEVLTFEIPEKGFEYIVSNYSIDGREIPTVLFLDINMPTWSGWDFLKNFEKLDQRIKKQIKIYMLSSSTQQSDKERSQETKITIDYLEKPLSSKTVSDIFLTEKFDFKNVKSNVTDDVVDEPFEENNLPKTPKINPVEKSVTLSRTKSLPDLLKDAKDLNDFKFIAAQFEKKSFKRKESLYREGDTNICLYFIQKGKVKTFKTNDYSKEFITGLYNTGDFLGYVSLLENLAYNETAVGLEDGEVSIIPKEVFQKLVYENADVSHKFIQLLSQNIREKEERLLTLAYNSVRQRVAGALLELQKKYLEEAGKKFSISFTREDLANIVGTATESLIRTLSDLKDEGAIEIDGSTISIIDKSRLEKIIS